MKSQLFDEVMVSTDDLEIAEIAKKYGAKIPFMRSKENADDFATTADVLLEVLDEYKKLGNEFDFLCCIYPTAPFVNPKKLKDSFNLLYNNNADSVIPVVKYSYPIQRSFRTKEENKLEYIWPENINKRSQDLEIAYHDAGQFYWSHIESFYKNKSLLNGNSFAVILSEMEVQDIDNANDWRIAEIKYELLNYQEEINEKI